MSSALPEAKAGSKLNCIYSSFISATSLLHLSAWLISFVAENEWLAIFIWSLQSLSNLWLSPYFPISSAPGPCRCCKFFERLSAWHWLKKSDSDLFLSLSDNPSHMCHPSISLRKTGLFLFLWDEQLLRTICGPAGHCRFLCDLRAERESEGEGGVKEVGEGPKEVKNRDCDSKRERQSRCWVEYIIITGWWRDRFKSPGDADTEINDCLVAPYSHTLKLIRKLIFIR